MPQYSFTIAAGGLPPEDEKVIFLDGPEEARAKLQEFASALLKDPGRHFWPTPVWHLTVTDEAGARVASISILGQRGKG